MSNTTTRALGWKLTRRDGAVLGFTDHDRDLTVDGVTYAAASALTASEAAAGLGLSVGDMDISGALSAAAITEADIEAGLYDGATVEVVEIDWQSGAKLRTVAVYGLGRVTRKGAAFTAELRSRASLLAQRRGRVVTATCDAELGDSRCGVALGPLTVSASVSAVISETEVRAGGLGAVPDGHFAFGLLTWTAGANAGQACEVRAHTGDRLGLWRPPLSPIQPGDAFDVTPGCDKTFATCRAKFANGDNFRGFPTIVGDEAFGYVRRGKAGYDGGSRNSF